MIKIVLISFNGEWTHLPTEEERKKEVFDLILSGTKDQTIRIEGARNEKINFTTPINLWWGKRGWSKDKWAHILDTIAMEKFLIEIKPKRRIFLKKPIFGKTVLNEVKDDNRFTYTYTKRLIRRDGFKKSEHFWENFKAGEYLVVRWKAPC